MNCASPAYKAGAFTILATAPRVARVSIELTTSALWAQRSCLLSYLAVGHRGIEPRHSCVSGSPLRPAGSWPADGGSRTLPRRAASPSMCRERRTRISASLDARPLSRRCPRPGGFTLHVRRTEILPPGRFIFHGGRRTNRKPQFPAHPLATEPGPWPVHLPCAPRGSRTLTPEGTRS